MDSVNIVFSDKDKVEVVCEPVEALGPGQVLIENVVSLISTGTETICLHRDYPKGSHWDRWVQDRFYPGYSSVGVVRQCGVEVTNVKVGHRFATSQPHKQFNVVEPHHVFPIPDGVSDDAASWFQIAEIVQIGVRRARLVLGDFVVIIGAGMLGQIATQYSRLSGAREIVVIDPAGKRLALAKACGATRCLAMTAEQAQETISEMTDGKMADVVFDITGHAAVLGPALAMTRQLGKLVMIGTAARPELQCLTDDLVVRGIELIGSHVGNAPQTESEHNRWTRANGVDLFFNYLRRGLMDVEPLISHRFNPHEAPEAFDRLLTERTEFMGVVFDWTQLACPNQ